MAPPTDKSGSGVGGLVRGVCTLQCGLAVLLVALAAADLLGCTAVQRVPNQSQSEKAFLQLSVEPPSAEVYIDESYKGTVEGWARGIVPLEPGDHRVELRADGYMTQRFDVSLEPGESKRLQLEMEPSLHDFSERAGR